MSKHLDANLKLLCSHYRSTSEVRRQLMINRAQFNEYLSGQSQPTPYNRERIGDSLGVEDYELGLPSEQFACLIGACASTRPRQPSDDLLLWLLQPLRVETSDLSRYRGYYLEYANCVSVPSSTLLFLVHFYGEDGVFLFKCQERQERTSNTDVQMEEWACYRHFGTAFQLQDRVFLVGYESLTLSETSQTIPIPSFRSCIIYSNGLKMGAPGDDQWTPACSRTVQEYLGAETNRINAHRQARLCRLDDPRINEDIHQRLVAGSLRHGLLETE